MSDLGEPMTVRADARIDDNGDPVAGTGGEITVLGVVEPGGGVDSDERGRAGTVTRYTVYVCEPPASPISRHHSIRIRGQWCHIDGEPRQWLDPETSELVGLVINAYRAEG